MRLARRELPIGDPCYDHIAKCPPCYQELRANQQADAAEHAAAVRRKRLAYAAAVLVVAIAGSWFALRQTGNTSGTAVSTTGGERQARLDLRPFAVTRGDERTKVPEGLVLSRVRLKATILLPVGSEPGNYEVQILDGDLVQASGILPTGSFTGRTQCPLSISVVTRHVATNTAAPTRRAAQLPDPRESPGWPGRMPRARRRQRARSARRQT